MRCLAASVAIAAIAGCTSYQSSFHRTRVDPGELVWAYDNQLQVSRDGKLIAEQDDWDGLPAAVACVPRARVWADSAVSRVRTGRVLTWTGFAVMVVGVVVGTALIIHDPRGDVGLVGLGVAGGGLLGGLSTAGAGLSLRARGDATAIDAVNLYNDERGACLRADQGSPPR